MEIRPLRFLILEKDAFVARDMTDGLSTADSECESLQFRGLDDLSEYLLATNAPCQRQCVVVTKLPIAEIDDSGLAAMTRQHGAEIVVRLGPDPVEKVEARGWFSLAAPFTWDDLAELVTTLRSPAREALTDWQGSASA